MSSEDNDNPYVHVFHRPPLYLLEDHDLSRIDSMLESLRLAISEIFAQRGVSREPAWISAAQDRFEEQAQSAVRGPESSKGSQGKTESD